ncbi:DNA polymerase III subunit delta [Clostridium cochlearium]|uniref:DNA polymerase III subunit delta n=1 Tax=Clostridium cochlearium TaxID=1494 RepID=UPI0018451E28|nr:DNA polymerase III subunit delta [Clostridium cochlearium]NMA58627.1 DNA polymerase III subunit delta [Clostridium cochlearium]
MFFQDLKKQLISNKLNNNKFILYSKDEYNVKTTIELLKKFISFPELNINEIDINNLENPEEIRNRCETIPFMSKKRLIIIKSDFLEENNKDKLKITNFLESYIKDVPNFTILVMYFYQKDKREKITKNKKVKKLEKSGALLVANNKNQKAENIELISDFLSKNKNIKIDNNVISYITGMANNLDVLKNDLNKINFLNGKITIEKVKEIFNSIEEDDMWDLTDTINAKNGVLALDILNNLLDKGIQPMQVIFNLTKQFKQLLYCKIKLMEGKNDKDISKELKLHPFVASILTSKSNNYSLKQLASNLEACIDLESKVKSIPTDTRSELEMLLINSLM